jgi:hypothetical protein
MGTPQDWAPYSSVEEAAKVYLRHPDLALDQVRSFVDLEAIMSFIMSRGSTEESWGEALWQPALGSAAADVHPTHHAVQTEVAHRNRHLLRDLPPFEVGR